MKDLWNEDDKALETYIILLYQKQFRENLTKLKNQYDKLPKTKDSVSLSLSRSFADNLFASAEGVLNTNLRLLRETDRLSYLKGCDC